MFTTSLLRMRRRHDCNLRLQNCRSVPLRQRLPPPPPPPPPPSPPPPPVPPFKSVPSNLAVTDKPPWGGSNRHGPHSSPAPHHRAGREGRQQQQFRRRGWHGALDGV